VTTKTVAEKLLIRPNTTLWASHPDRLDLISPLPEGVQTVEAMSQATTGLIFADDSSSLQAILASHNGDLTRAGTIWIAYPKANKADINRDTLWPLLTQYGMRPIGQVAVDDLWSAIRFRPLKEGEAPFNPGGGQ
jgi:hypothetical protein